MRYFVINWYSNKDKFERFTSIMTGGDTQNALNIFMKEYGNLKRNTINYIQEMVPTNAKDNDKLFGFKKNLVPKGERIVPDDDVTLIPA